MRLRRGAPPVRRINRVRRGELPDLEALKLAEALLLEVVREILVVRAPLVVAAVSQVDRVVEVTPETKVPALTTVAQDLPIARAAVSRAVQLEAARRAEADPAEVALNWALVKAIRGNRVVQPLVVETVLSRLLRVRAIQKLKSAPLR